MMTEGLDGHGPVEVAVIAAEGGDQRIVHRTIAF
jgi:hypothetical protein